MRPNNFKVFMSDGKVTPHCHPRLTRMNSPNHGDGVSSRGCIKPGTLPSYLRVMLRPFSCQVSIQSIRAPRWCFQESKMFTSSRLSLLLVACCKLLLLSYVNLMLMIFFLVLVSISHPYQPSSEPNNMWTISTTLKEQPRGVFKQHLQEVLLLEPVSALQDRSSLLLSVSGEVSFALCYQRSVKGDDVVFFCTNSVCA